VLLEKYTNCLVDQILADELEIFGAAYITGPKWCGKTTPGLQVAKSALVLQDPDQRSQDLVMADLNKHGYFKKTGADNANQNRSIRSRMGDCL
jgi:hypothetical protein